MSAHRTQFQSELKSQRTTHARKRRNRADQQLLSQIVAARVLRVRLAVALVRITAASYRNRAANDHGHKPRTVSTIVLIKIAITTALLASASNQRRRRSPPREVEYERKVQSSNGSRRRRQHSSRSQRVARERVERERFDYGELTTRFFEDAIFFIMKSNNHENIALSKARGVWSTPPQNEHKLNRAFKDYRNVILVFSVKESGHFQGFARLASESNHERSPVQWILPPGLNLKALGGVFKLDWICRNELPFSRTLHLFNPLNEGK